MKKPNSVLVIQTAFLGDVILATPIVSELNRLFPQVKIDFLVKKGNEILLSNNPAIRDVYVLDKSKNKLVEIWRLIRKFRSKRYDLVINLHRFGSSGIIAGLSGGKQIVGFDKNPFAFLYSNRFKHEIGNGTHEVTRNLALIKEFGAATICRPSLFPSAKDVQSVEVYTAEKFVCLAPASVWKTKQLPEEKWVELIQSFASDLLIYLVGANSDKALCQAIIDKSGRVERIVNLAGKFSLLQTAALFAKSQHVYVNDSGPLHVASAMNAPVTAFFCSTIPEFGFGPLSDLSEIKQVEKLECRPCGLHGKKECPLGHFNCGKQIIISILPE
jgi:heptosyltransferase-2